MAASELPRRSFYKVTGSGNDFVVFDARREPPGVLERPEVMRRICARGTGVGADGVVFIEQSSTPDADLRMRYFNSDGSRAQLCGNAALCVTRLAACELGAGPAAGMRLETDAGVLVAQFADGLAAVELEPVSDVRPDIRIQREPEEERIGFAMAGVPHLVLLCRDVARVDVLRRGRQLRMHSAFERGANVNFVSPVPNGRWRIRTYERGVEGETLACGTGAVATAILLRSWNVSEQRVPLETRSGRAVEVLLRRSNAAWVPTLRGEGRLVYTGQLAES